MTEVPTTIEGARRFLADALGCELAAVEADARLGAPRAWDSIGHMRLVLALEERLGRALSTDEIVGIGGLADVEHILESGTGAG